MDEFQMPSPTTQVVMPSKMYDSDFTRWLLQFKEQLDLLYHDLLGEVEIKKDNKKEWCKKGDAQLNEKGTVYIISALRDTTNQYAMMSNIKEQEAYTIARDTCDGIAIGLAMHEREYNLNPISLYTIMPKVRNMVQLALLRAVNGEERRIIHTTESVSRNYSNEPQMQKQTGWFGLPKIF